MSAARRERGGITSSFKCRLSGLGCGKPDAKSIETRFARAIVVIGLAGLMANCGIVSAKALRHIRKFDIICWVSGHTYRANHPELLGYAEYAMPHSWSYDFHYRIDLKKGTYTDVVPKDEFTRKIAFTTRRIITFVKTKDEHETFDLRTRRYLSTSTLSAYQDGFAAGSCRFARYSGR